MSLSIEAIATKCETGEGEIKIKLKIIYGKRQKFQFHELLS